MFVHPVLEGRTQWKPHTPFKHARGLFQFPSLSPLSCALGSIGETGYVDAPDSASQ